MRGWACPHCHQKNESNKRTCSNCGIRKNAKRTSIKARCDSLARELCKKLAKGICAKCGRPGSDWSHRVSRKHHSVRWDVCGNSDFLCRECHRTFTDRPFAFAEWLKSQGVDLEALERRAAGRWDGDYPRIIRELGDQLDAIKET